MNIVLIYLYDTMAGSKGKGEINRTRGYGVNGLVLLVTVLMSLKGRNFIFA